MAVVRAKTHTQMEKTKFIDNTQLKVILQEMDNVCSYRTGKLSNLQAT